MSSWFRHHLSKIIYVACGIIVVALSVSAWQGPNWTQRMVTARELFGLWAFGVLVGSMLIGPIVTILPRLPGRALLLGSRRSLGISAFILAVPHVAWYVVPVLVRSWHQFFAPGILWVIGLGLGLLAFTDLTILAYTSRDSCIASMGAKRWKQLHRTIHWVFLIVLIHAMCQGSDFGIAHPPDAGGTEDFGCLITFSLLVLAWIILFILRARGIKWPRSFSK